MQVWQNFSGKHKPSLHEGLGSGNIAIHAKVNEVKYVKHNTPLSIKWMVSGKRKYELENVPIAVEGNQILIINEDHDYVSYIDDNSTVESLCFFFHPEITTEIYRLHNEHLVSLLDAPHKIIAPIQFFEKTYPVGNETIKYFQTLYQSIQEPFQLDQNWWDEQFYQLGLIIFRLNNVALKQANQLPNTRLSTRLELYRRVNVAREYIASDFCKHLPLISIAKASQLSQYHLIRLFKEVFEITPHQYIIKKRLEKAVQLLNKTKLPVKMICFEVGFEDISSFIRLFRQHFGVTPKSYREK